MRINHIAMYVNDLETTKQFFINYFSATSNERYRNLMTGLQTYFLSFEDSTRLEIMTNLDMSNSNKHRNKQDISIINKKTAKCCHIF